MSRLLFISFEAFVPATLPVAGTVTIGGAPAPDGKTVQVFSIDSANNVALVGTTTTGGGTGSFLVSVSSGSMQYFASYVDGANIGRSAYGAAGGSFSIVIGGGGVVGSRAWTLAQLIAAVQHRGSYEGSQDITPALITEYLNEAIAELWDLLVQKWEDYYTISATFPFVVGTDSYQPPAGFYKLRKLEMQWDTTPTWRRLEPHDLAVSHEYRQVYNRRYRYRLQAGYLVFVPVPVADETIRIYYIPCAPILVGSSDTIDGVNGYEELVIQLAFLRCKRREELDTSDIEREIARLSSRIRTASDGRDATEPFLLDTHAHRRSHGWHDPDGNGWGY